MPMSPDPMYKDFILLSVGIFLIGAVTIIRKVRAGHHVPLSVHATSDKGSYAIFVSCLTLSAVCLYLFNLRWFTPELGLPVIFTIVLNLGLICSLIVAWVPSKKGNRRNVHNAAAYGIVFTLPIMIGLLLATASLSWTAQVVAFFSLAGLLSVFCLLFFIKTARPYFLLNQIFYMLFFFGTLVIATYA